MSIHIDNLSYRKDLFALSEAMLYAFNREPKSDDDEQTKRYWVGQILSTSKLDVCKQIEETKNKYSKELSNSPILSALLNFYIETTKTYDLAKLQELYLSFQQLQKDLPFSENKQAYVEAGCGLTTGLFGQDEDKIFLYYPVHLYSSYIENGGNTDQHRGGYFFPAHKLSIEELKELEEIHPALFESGMVNKAYKAMQK
jgi:hypothetical protein